MAKAKRKKVEPILPLDGPTEAQLANGVYEREVIIHGEDGARATVHINRECNVLERWMDEGGDGFGPGACQAIRDCQFFWSRLSGPRLIANYGERIPSGRCDGVGQSEALSELAHYSKGIPQPYWEVFENVCRFGEPAGVAGSRYAKNKPQQIQSAKVITGFVASLIASKLGY